MSKAELRLGAHASVRSMMAKAIAAGALRVSMGHYEWDMSGNCESPRRIERYARAPRPNPYISGLSDADYQIHEGGPKELWSEPKDALINRPLTSKPGPSKLTGRLYWSMMAAGSATRKNSPPEPQRKPAISRGTSLWVSQIVRCGKCAACLRVRQRKWQTRAHIECKRSGRTWFGTLTVSPKRHYQVKAECCKALVQSVSGDFDALQQDVQFAKRHAVISREITLWLKRIRKAAKGRLRMLLVAEAHEGGGDNHGLPHYHVLIHEIDEGSNVTKAVLEDRWRWGHSHWRLVRDGEANNRVSYLCKYLGKSKASRIRASLMYGKTSSDIAQGVETPKREANDPTNLHCLTTDALASVERAAGERQEGIGGTVLTGSDGLSESQHHKLSSCPVQHPWRAAAAARLGGPDSINAFRKLAAKHNARLQEPQNANRIDHAWLGHKQSPTGPFDYPADPSSGQERDSNEESGPSVACVQARRDDDECDSSGRRNRDQWQKE